MRELRGRVVIVTRPEGQSAELSTALRARGAEVIEAPAIRIESVPAGGALDEAIGETAGGRYSWVVFTSAAGVEAWFDRAAALQCGLEDLRAHVAVVGTGTAEALEARGREPDLIPDTFTTLALGEAFPAGTGEVLLARADAASGELDGALRAKGWTPVRVDAYRTVLAEELPADARAALEAGKVDAVAFTSASTVRGFVGAAGRVPPGIPAVCIGPVTSAAARDAGMEVAAEADPHTVEGLAEAIARTLVA
jgi:uroporphyrinogen-III synthase